jgi:uncharacterized protein YdhG (YjbR/CyaY superfamily)
VNGNATDVDAYLASLPEDARDALSLVRAAIKAAAPEAVESISYGMPTFKYRGKPLIYFMAAKKHCALYGTAEGTIRFPPAEPPPAARLQALVAARIADIESGKPRQRTKTPPS